MQILQDDDEDEDDVDSLRFYCLSLPALFLLVDFDKLGFERLLVGSVSLEDDLLSDELDDEFLVFLLSTKTGLDFVSTILLLSLIKIWPSSFCLFTDSELLSILFFLLLFCSLLLSLSSSDIFLTLLISLLSAAIHSFLALPRASALALTSFLGKLTSPSFLSSSLFKILCRNLFSKSMILSLELS